MKRILFDEKDFETLISGGIVVSKDGVEIALQDIGYDLMYNILDKVREASFMNRDACDNDDPDDMCYNCTCWKHTRAMCS